MFFIYSWWTYLILIPGLLLTSYAEIKVSSAYRKYGKIPSNAHWGRRSRTTPRVPRHREMRAFVSCMA